MQSLICSPITARTHAPLLQVLAQCKQYMLRACLYLSCLTCQTLANGFAKLHQLLRCKNSSFVAQVKNREGQWINADPIPGTFVCNIGDMLKVRFVAASYLQKHPLAPDCIYSLVPCVSTLQCALQCTCASMVHISPTPHVMENTF